MASNSFGQLFRITTWGESHGKAIGVVIDGCPAGIEISESDINDALALRATGRNGYTSPRKEKEEAQILSGIFEGKTTGTPISIVIDNQDHDSSKYEPIKNLHRPGHANYTYLEKYGVFDYRGGGRSSARETACRVAAGAIAKKALAHLGIDCLAYVASVGNIEAYAFDQAHERARKAIYENPVFCHDSAAAQQIMQAINHAKENGDSLGAVIGFHISGVPAGLGDPIYEKLEANLAKAMLSINASKGFEIGEGFRAARMMGSEHNDVFQSSEGKTTLGSNHAGGTLGGISNGEAIVGRVAFKPTSSIMKTQQTTDLEGKSAEFKLPEGSRHDPCVGIRAVPIVEAMCALVIFDAVLMNRVAKL
ncbi:MAG: chorismate synthase [Gammaproteobacteria bacterium CG11_big_fil_rev_8_21_14_0_20_46_22]|nr:MAG: chorismate synthase [Gammaproteobacteria bacterium CG12_big_fil_rev_8_21_14_0_65_46_12]PIR10723.1 MAG: chorismate synthase [Gammaproteobacteria bacterium CG11_big_fil_rev_8_21_14_0_20_46_22]